MPIIETTPHNYDVNKPPKSEEEKLARIKAVYVIVRFPDGTDGVVIKGTQQDIREEDTPKNASQVVNVDSGYKEKFYRLKFALQNDRFPTDQVDHADGDRQNNRLDNLREATSQENNRNRKPPKRKDPTVPRGVYAYKTKAGIRYRAQVTIDGRKKSLGNFDTIVEASSAFEEFCRSKYGPYYREK